MYIFITEFDILYGDYISEESKEAFDIGILSIINLSGEIPKELDSDGNWIPIRKIED